MRNRNPSRAELIEWLESRATANEKFLGRVDALGLDLIRREWPGYLRAAAAMLRRDWRDTDPTTGGHSHPEKP